MNDNFSVMGMVEAYASENNIDESDIFKKEEKVETIQETPNNDKGPWMPDESQLEDMPELKSTPVIYDKSEMIEVSNEPLKNIADEDAKQQALETMNDLQRKDANILELKRRRGYGKLQIPEGEYHVKIMNAASDTNYKNAQDNLDKIFDEIESIHPEYILERISEKSSSMDNSSLKDNIGKIENIPDNVEPIKTVKEETNEFGEDTKEEVNDQITPPESTKVVNISIDKTSLNEVAWTSEEIEKIKKARTIELNIVESENIKFGDIEDVEDVNAVDRILEQYQRKSNDTIGALPASKYRATFTGLSYPEVLDLTSSQEMNSIDGERKKWSICFNHIKNPSIGAWEEYNIYKDPTTGKEVKAAVGENIPEGVEIHYVSKYEDFLRKTSFLDLDFMLWKILCATSLDAELISIDCHAINNGIECGHTYDWLYRPESLLIMEEIDTAILEEMKEAGEASTSESINKVYNTSPVRSNSTVELTQAGWKLIVGHVSAYHYLEEIYSIIKSLEDSEETDPTIISRGMAYATLTVIKGILIQNGDKWMRIKDPENIVKAINKLDEIDWQTISKLTELLINPYQFRYALKDIICPKCKNKSTIGIDDMSRMLFILARSLSSVQVTLKKA